MNFDISRSVEVFNPEVVEKPIYIIGCGATGSHVAETFCRFGIKKMYLIDGDTVGPENLNNQSFMIQHVGLNKAKALKDLCENINPEIQIETIEEYVTPEEIKEMSGYVFCLVDSMKTRKELFEAIKENKNIEWYWESRLGSDQGRVYCLPIKEDFDYSTYESMHFYSDDDSEVSACGTSITIVRFVLQTAALMVNQFIKIVMGQENKEPYLKHFTLFDNMYNVYTENFSQEVKEVEEITDELIM